MRFHGIAVSDWVEVSATHVIGYFIQVLQAITGKGKNIGERNFLCRILQEWINLSVEAGIRFKLFNAGADTGFRALSELSRIGAV